MNTKWKTTLAGISLFSLCSAASADDRVHFSISFGVPAPVLAYAPPPVAYYAPVPVYVAPRIYTPAPLYVSGPPRAYFYHHHPARWRGHGNGHWKRHRHWR